MFSVTENIIYTTHYILVSIYFFAQTLKYSSKSHLGGDHRHEKMPDSSDITPPCKIIRRSDSPEKKQIDNTGYSRSKAVHAHRTRDDDGGETY